MVLSNIVYIIIIVAAGYWSYRYDGKPSDTKQEHRYMLLGLMLILTTGLSYGLGGDKFVYLEDFSLYKATPSQFASEIGYYYKMYGYMPLWTLLCLVTKWLTGSIYVFQTIQALAVNAAILYTIKRWTNKPFLFVLLYFLGGMYFRFNTEVMREGVAIACCLMGWNTYDRGHHGRMLIWTICGIGFHFGAIIMLLFYLLPRLKPTLRLLLIAQVVALVAWMMSDLLVNVLLPLVLNQFGKNGTKIAGYIMVYSNFFGFLRYYLIYLGLPSVVLYFAYEQAESSQRERYERWILFTILLGIVACSMTGLVRLTNYVRIFYLAMLAEVVYSLWSYKAHLIIRHCAVIGIIVLNIWGNLTYWPGCRFYYYEFFLPYTSILDESVNVKNREAAHWEAVSADNVARR